MKKIVINILKFVVILSVTTGIGCLLGLELANSLWIGLSCTTIWTIEPIVVGIMKGSGEKFLKIAGIFLSILILTAIFCQLCGIILDDTELRQWTDDIIFGLINASFSIFFPIGEVYFKKK